MVNDNEHEIYLPFWTMAGDLEGGTLAEAFKLGFDFRCALEFLESKTHPGQELLICCPNSERVRKVAERWKIEIEFEEYDSEYRIIRKVEVEKHEDS